MSNAENGKIKRDIAKFGCYSAVFVAAITCLSAVIVALIQVGPSTLNMIIDGFSAPKLTPTALINTALPPLTLSPTSTPLPTFTPTNTATDIPIPIATPISVSPPTDTPVLPPPTDTPVPPLTETPTQPIVTPTPTPSPTDTPPLPTSTPTNTPTAPPTATPTPTPSPLPECRLNNLLNCGKPIPIFVEGQSTCTATSISGNLVVEFNNQQNGSGVAFQFTPPLDVKDFNFVELSGTSTQNFTFLLEYKVNVGGQLNNVTSSTQQSFPANSDTQTIRIPIAYGDSIDELAINFFTKGQSSTLLIESIRLKQ